MAELPILPLNVAALISDTSGMSAEEFGAYGRILFTMWLHGGRLPHDDKKLRRIAGVHHIRWPHIRNTVMYPFTISDGVISQKRLTDTFLRVREVRAKRAVAGARGGLSRWGGRNFVRGVIDNISTFPKPLK